MQQPPSGASTRSLRVVLWGIFGVQLVAATAAVLLVRSGSGPVLGRRLEHLVAYAWVALTIAGATGAYLLSQRRPDERVAFGRAFTAALLAAVAGLAGVAAFFLVKVWPMLVVGLLAALLGIAAPYPRRETPASPAAGDDDGSAGPARSGGAPAEQGSPR